MELDLLGRSCCIVRVLYVGMANKFSSTLSEVMIGEGNEFSIISANTYNSKNKPKVKHKKYEYPNSLMALQRILAEAHPEVVIYGGDMLGDHLWEDKEQRKIYHVSLLDLLESVQATGFKKFIFLSSTEVYQTDSTNKINEESEQSPTSLKGLWCVQGEMLCRKMIQDDSLVIMRVASMYGYTHSCKVDDIVSSTIEDVLSDRQIITYDNKKHTLIHIHDVATALAQAVTFSEKDVYNIAGDKAYTRRDLHHNLTTIINEKPSEEKELGQVAVSQSQIDSSRAKNEFEWMPKTELNNVIKSCADEYQHENKKEITKTSSRKKYVEFHANNEVIALLENLVLFALFVAMVQLWSDHYIFQNIALMCIYVVLASVAFNIRQSIVAIILASAFHMYLNFMDSGNFLMAILRIENLAVICQYILIGSVVGYAINYFKLILLEKKDDVEYISAELADVKQAYNQITQIRNEYQERLLSSANSLPRLYNMITALEKTEIESVYLSAVEVIGKLMNSNTVAIYIHKKGYLRLMESSTLDTKIGETRSIRLDEYPQMKEQILKSGVFVNHDAKREYPDLASGVFKNNNLIAIIAIMEVEYSQITLYQTNLLRTISHMIMASLDRANSFISLKEDFRFVKGTKIIASETFEQLLSIRKDARKHHFSDFLLLNIENKRELTPIELDITLSPHCRENDYVCVDKDNNYYMLLSNASQDDAKKIIERLSEAEFTANMSAY